jgi:Zn-dependent peptidase ImmA (M78 family)
MQSVKITNIKPNVLTWARRSIGLSTQEVNDKLNKGKKTKIDIAEVESGKKYLTFAQLKILSDLYKRHLAFFFLQKPPKKAPLPKDFRTFGSVKIVSPLSKKTLLFIRKARYIQDIAKDLFQDLNLKFDLSLPKTDLSDDPFVLANKIRNQIGLNIQTQQKIKDSREFFTYLREQIEKFGVIIIKPSFENSFPVKEARGFCLVDKKPYLIAVNNGDTDNAKVFTLMHEFCHVLLRLSGICLDIESQELENHSEVAKVETFCNRFAASFLVPFDDLKGNISNLGIENDKFDQNVFELTKKYKVSSFVILGRLVSNNIISQNFYNNKIKEWKKDFENKPKKQGGMRHSGKDELQMNGHLYSKAVFESFNNDKINYNDISDYLSIKIKNIPLLESEIYQN